MGTKQITEDDFLQLIREKSAGKEKENKTPSPEVKREPPAAANKSKEVRKPKEEPTSTKTKEMGKPNAQSTIKKEVKEEEVVKPKAKTPLEEAIGFQIPKIPVPQAETIVSTGTSN